jgi:type I restriction enzyme M protein
MALGKDPGGKVAEIYLRRDRGPGQASLDLFWLKDKSLADLDNLPDPDVLASDIIENLEAAVESFKEIAQRF